MTNQMLRHRGVYFLDGKPYAALPNNEGDDAYAFALAEVEPKGKGYALKEFQDFSLFVDTDGKLFSVYARDDRAKGKTVRSLKDRGLTVPARDREEQTAA